MGYGHYERGFPEYVSVAERRRRAQARAAEEEGARAEADRARRSRHRHDLLGKGVVRPPRVARRPREPASAGADLRPQRLGRRPPDWEGRGPRAGLRQRDLRGEGGHRATLGTTLEGGPPGVRRTDRDGGRAPRGEGLVRGDGGAHPPAEGALPRHPRALHVVLLPGRRLALQAPRSGPVRRGRPPRSCTGAALHAAWRRRRRAHRGRGKSGSPREWARRRRDRRGPPLRDLRDRARRRRAWRHDPGQEALSASGQSVPSDALARKGKGRFEDGPRDRAADSIADAVSPTIKSAEARSSCGSSDARNGPAGSTRPLPTPRASTKRNERSLISDGF